MFVTNITCPKCKDRHQYIWTFQNEEKRYYIGDKVEKMGTYATTLTCKCLTCGKEFRVDVLVQDGYIVNAILNPLKKQIRDIESGYYEALFNYPTKTYTERFEALLGEDTVLIPKQYQTKTELKRGSSVIVFDSLWMVLERYKVYSEPEKLYARIYKLRTYKAKIIERLLICRDKFLPVLKEVDWSDELYKDDEDSFRRFKIPTGYDVVMY
jgi:hypothetical protein